jgi:hypothetical protein
MLAPLGVIYRDYFLLIYARNPKSYLFTTVTACFPICQQKNPAKVSLSGIILSAHRKLVSL